MSDFLSNGKTRIFYEDFGEGRPIVFVHGWPLSGAMWEYQVVPLLKAGFRCVTYDRRGFGRSSKPDSGYDYATLGRDLASLIEHLNLRDVTLVGFSMGGGEVIEYLAHHNMLRRVTKAVLAASIVPYMLKTDDNPDGVPSSVFDDIQKSLKNDRPGFLTNFGKTFFGADENPAAVSDAFLASTCELAMHASPIATLECVTSFGTTDFRDVVGGVDVPVLVIHGDSDSIVPIKTSGEAAANVIGDAELKVYSGAPHGLHYTHRDQFNQDIAAFASEGRVKLDSAA